ncbi:MAG TPA: hypothetical protein VMB34_06340 [Acetobacteraceae bacterium]|nr:hypothetical protein [Acetobacteraceae bacterium]
MKSDLKPAASPVGMKSFCNFFHAILIVMDQNPQHRPSLDDLTSAELRARAMEYRQMAHGSRMIRVPEALLRLAQQYDRLAAETEAQGR